MKLFTRLGLTAAAVAMATGLAVSKPEPAGGTLNLLAMTTSMNVSGYSAVQRTLSGNYTTPKKAPAGASASMTIPAGLGVPGPIPWTVQNDQATTGGGTFESISYWGCSETILKGQPAVYKGSWQGGEQQWTNGSSGYTDPMKLMGINENSKVPGTYNIKISYLGEVSIPMTEAQQFLDPLTVTAPASPQVDTTKAIHVSWKAVPRAQGYSVMATGKNAKGKTVFWENAKHATSTWYTSGVAAAVKAGKLKSPQDCSCIVPAGIFKGQVTLMVNAYSAEAKGKGVLPAYGWAQSTGTMMLGE